MSSGAATATVDGAKMGVGMQIVYLGLTGSHCLEAEAAAQLIRLERYHAIIANCSLTIGATRSGAGPIGYDVRLHVVTAGDGAGFTGYGRGESAALAIGSAFDAAEHRLQAVATRTRKRSD
ncbi:hypothetical protein [Paraburkholderia azotifigens]|uniref:2-isopropylmalate synthase LeuA allosteric (dimerisation) domain-containing protein n=1 Tax=Paraburkholderia azotifigens TaxID=2057004 RepID=A0ABU9R480_9BURK